MESELISGFCTIKWMKVPLFLDGTLIRHDSSQEMTLVHFHPTPEGWKGELA